MGKKQKALWRVFLKGALLTFGVYLAGLLLLALLVTKGIVPEAAAYTATVALCVAAALCGGVATAKGTPWGTLPSALANGGVFALGLITIGLSCWQGITWTGRGGVLLLSILGGAILAGVISGRKRKRKKRPL